MYTLEFERRAPAGLEILDRAVLGGPTASADYMIDRGRRIAAMVRTAPRPPTTFAVRRDGVLLHREAI